MLVFRVLRACKGAGGFIGELGEASSGAGGFNLAMFLCPVREIVLPEGLRHPKFGVFGRAGRVCSRHRVLRRGLVGGAAPSMSVAVGVLQH